MSILIAKDQVKEPLYCVVPHYNPWRHKSRTKHTERAIKHFHDAGAVIVLVEIGFNRRELSFADSGLDGTPANCGILGSDPKFRHRYIGLHTKHELWLKENAINVGVQHLPHDWQQVCWPDSDIHFARPNWVGECIHKLQHYSFVQMFSQACDLGPNYEVLASSPGPSFVQLWKTGGLKAAADYTKPPAPGCPIEPPWPGWPGLAWCCTRQAWDIVGGLFDVGVWGGADYDMGFALVERVSEIHAEAHPNYRAMLAEWEDRCRWGIRKNVGVMEGMVMHHWHGRKNGRRYSAKRKLMCKVSFDPMRHLKRDAQGLWQMHDDGSDNFVNFRDVMRQIAAERNEDSIDV